MKRRIILWCFILLAADLDAASTVRRISARQEKNIWNTSDVWGSKGGKTGRESPRKEEIRPAGLSHVLSAGSCSLFR
jgi:hypothetical protein